jgi:serine protease
MSNSHFPRWRWLSGALLGTLFAVTAMAQTTADATEPASPARVIVKFRSSSALVAKAAQEGAVRPAHARALQQRMGIALTDGEAISVQTQVVFAAGMSSTALAERLAAESDVEYAVPDERRHAFTAPNDPLYMTVAGNGQASGQWYLRAPTGTVASGINIESAWDVTMGSPSVVVAVVDTGVRYEHPDLLATSVGGNLLPGYTMISNLDVANNGKGRDADASDPGDWVTTAESTTKGSAYYGCGAQDSSWHGTMVSGLIAALTNNATGMAGAGPNLRVLPVRVLGKCGGFDSDIIAGMRWAAGLSVAGVPLNPNPARVLNLSLGGPGACSAAFADVISEITAKGIVIVVAAGNSTGHPVGSPGNCSGVLTVVALRHAGNKVGYSDMGPEVGIAAPGGNCVNTTAGSACLYPILSTSNAGTTGPGAAIYTDSYNVSLGTSFSAPLAAATAGLMFSANPALTPADVHRLLQATARPFPTSGAEDATTPVIPLCNAPSATVDQLQCYCTTTTCGAGMLDAGAAVASAAAGTGTSGSQVSAVEYYWAARDHYFITADTAEVAALDSGKFVGWQRTGYSFSAYAGTTDGTNPVCRYYIPAPWGDSHFFSASAYECAQVKVKFPQFIAETDAAFYVTLPNTATGACASGTMPVYRLWDQRVDTNHRLTSNRAQRDLMVTKGWVAEGYGSDPVAMCAPQ